MGDLGIQSPLWLITRGAVSIGDNDPLLSPLQAMTWGLGRVIGLEHPDRWGGLLDLPEMLDPEILKHLLAALGNETGEDQIAIRSAGVFVRRLVRAPLGKSGVEGAYKPQGTILITGGTGAIGGHVARRLATLGAEHLVLISRRGMEAPGASDLLNELTALGARTTIAACNIADLRALTELVERIDSQGPPVQSVFHAGGVSGKYLPIAANTLDNLADAISNKVIGAQNLHRVFGERDMDAFVLFSSISGIWGSADLSGYAAANAFLDALAEQRRAMGLTATAVAWGVWAGGGMAGGPDAVANLANLGKRGVIPMPPDLAVSALWESLDRAETALVAANMDWARFAPSFSAARRQPLLNDLPEAQSAAASKETAATKDRRIELFEQLSNLSQDERKRTLLNLVNREASAVLRLASVEADRPLKELGLDSLMAVEVSNRIAASTGLQLPTTLLFRYPTVTAVAELIESQIMNSPHVKQSQDDEIQRALASIPIHRLREAGLIDTLLHLAGKGNGTSTQSAKSVSEIDAISTMSLDEMVEMALKQ
jgi:NAD(P)-dependent dehydrogenase (short-subunit alcohol dehydrogenase family)/acyl carrier protein